MTEEKNYLELMSELARVGKAKITRANMIIFLLVTLIIFGFFLAIDTRQKFATSIRVNDAKRDLWLKQASNIIELNSQQIDSMRRLDNSIRRGNDSLDLKIQLINNCR